MTISLLQEFEQRLDKSTVALHLAVENLFLCRFSRLQLCRFEKLEGQALSKGLVEEPFDSRRVREYCFPA